jgi:hypothetical protein
VAWRAKLRCLLLFVVDGHSHATPRMKSVAPSAASFVSSSLAQPNEQPPPPYCYSTIGTNIPLRHHKRQSAQLHSHTSNRPRQLVHKLHQHAGLPSSKLSRRARDHIEQRHFCARITRSNHGTQQREGRQGGLHRQHPIRSVHLGRAYLRQQLTKQQQA